MMSSPLPLSSPTVMTKISEAVSLPSLAVTTMLIVPASLSAGVPEKAPVAGLKLSQAGRLPPPSRVAE